MPPPRAPSALLCLAVTLGAFSGCVAARQRGDVPAAPPEVIATPQPTPSATPTAVPTAAQRASDGSAPHEPPPRVVVLIGDSTTYGTPRKGAGMQSRYEPAATLRTLLADIEPPPSQGGSRWHGARVENYAVPASNTEYWTRRATFGCRMLREFAVVKEACAARVDWLQAVQRLAGRKPDAVIVDLGLNDSKITQDPAATVDRLLEIRQRLAPSPVLFYPPMAPNSEWTERVRAEMESRGLFATPEYPHHVPTFDGIHPTDGGYAAKAGLWLDGLRKVP